MSLLRLTYRRNVLRAFHTTRLLLSESTNAQHSSVLSTLQPELKTALRSKDKPRLTVLRSLLAEITNASKTSKPIATDASLFSLLSKQIKASQAAVEEFEKAKRDDLVEKERSQLSVLEGLLNKIEKVDDGEIREAVAEVVKEGKGNNVGAVIGKTMGKFGGRPVDAEAVRRIVGEVLGEKA
ncbi:hypothetical protein N0V90_009748 [Kalmusia sp. IMI 367209]|nr:hypothetical protein N0V90_009748 [Kalmusia sp. IMI 367209]